MKRGDLYRVRRPPGGDLTSSSAFVVVSRQTHIDSRFSTVVAAPVYTRRDGLSTQVDIGPSQGLRHDSSIHYDALVSLSKAMLTDFIGGLGDERLAALDAAIRIALAVE